MKSLAQLKYDLDKRLKEFYEEYEKAQRDYEQQALIEILLEDLLEIFELKIETNWGSQQRCIDGSWG